MNNILEAIAIGVVVFITLLSLWHLISRKSASPGGVKGNANTAPPATDSFTGAKPTPSVEIVEAEVRMLVDYGNTTEAIRILREKLKLDLQDAKALVDKMEQGAPLVIERQAPDQKDANSVDHEARLLAANGRHIEAIKLVRERKGLGLKEAEAYVERL